MIQLLYFMLEIRPFLFQFKTEKQTLCCGIYGSAKIHKLYVGPFMIGVSIPSGKYGERLK